MQSIPIHLKKHVADTIRTTIDGADSSQHFHHSLWRWVPLPTLPPFPNSITVTAAHWHARWTSFIGASHDLSPSLKGKQKAMPRVALGTSRWRGKCSFSPMIMSSCRGAFCHVRKSSFFYVFHDTGAPALGDVRRDLIFNFYNYNFFYNFYFYRWFDIEVNVTQRVWFIYLYSLV